LHIAAVIQDVWSVVEVLSERGDGVLTDVKPPDVASLVAFMKKVAAHGPASLPDNRSHHVSTEDPKIWQFDVTGTLRLLWFYDEGRLVVVAGCFYKQGGKKKTTPRALVSQAQTTYRQYFEAKANGTLHIEIEDEDEDQ